MDGGIKSRHDDKGDESEPRAASITCSQGAAGVRQVPVMNSQTRDYYADLGISSSASADQIRVTYHALAKVYHPDVNKDRAATDKFRNITEAYEVLRDPEKRRAYDSARFKSKSRLEHGRTTSTKRNNDEPIRCDSCGSYTALPQLRQYRQIISFIVSSKVTSKSGIYCTHCAAKAALQASIVSSALGWWGIPSGPILTVKAIVGNALGGKRDRRADEQLQWHNAVAFLDLGKLDLSIALASRLRSAQDKEIREKSKELYDALIAEGVKPRQFKKSWATEMSYGLAQLIGGALIPCALLFIFINERITKNDYSRGKMISASYNENMEVKNREFITKNNWQLNTCKNKPLNGTIIQSRIILFARGNSLTIKNREYGDAIVKIRDAQTGQLLMSFFVANGKKTTIKGIENGRYDIQYAIGTIINESCSGFIEESAYRFPGVHALTTRHTIVGTSIQTEPEKLSFTLHSVPGGNLKPERISDAEFNAN